MMHRCATPVAVVLFGLAAGLSAQSPLTAGARADRTAGPAGKNSIGMEFVLIPPGEFVMGSNFTGERPPHRVRITKAFELGKYEVTQGQWEAVMGNNPSHRRGADRPVENVSWEDAQAFLRRLNERKDGYRYRLPTEAEWEWAARGGGGDFSHQDKDTWWFEESPAVAWSALNSNEQIQPVGGKPANGFGLYDMLGNAWEWVQDWFDVEYYKKSPVQDPQGPPSGEERLARGGSALDGPWTTRVTARTFAEPGFRNQGAGFRCAREKAP